MEKLTEDEIESIRENIQGESIIETEKIDFLKMKQETAQKDFIIFGELFLECLMILKNNRESLTDTEDIQKKLSEFLKSYEITNLRNLYSEYRKGSSYGDYWVGLKIIDDIKLNRNSYEEVTTLFFKIFTEEF